MKINTVTANIPAGYEVLEDTPLHRYQRSWGATRSENTKRKVKSDPAALNDEQLNCD